MGELQRQIGGQAADAAHVTAEVALFDVEPAPERPKLSGDARRRNRQDEAMRHGQHPLAVTLKTSIPLHPKAPADATDRTVKGLRCGSCRHRESGAVRGFPKCMLPGPTGLPRVTRGPGTDCRGWWPACASWERREERAR
ncbi:hypothetical protein ABT297_04195 [Dactylosporangium sp. NPDC000555]|uniref:hypothetical protein n=1 Tax=Dactylosporangium sp. NPDC000555 TaxID=3154260 RepID=UPI0033309DFD